MKKLALSLLLLLIWCGPALADDCQCEPIEYDQLLNMPVGEIKAKMEQYERLSQGYLHGSSSSCYYTCVTEYERLYAAKVQKDRKQAKARAARRATPPESVPSQRLFSSEPAAPPVRP